jgi:pimeloyl-ACP methyl ester carboxylesterase
LSRSLFSTDLLARARTALPHSPRTNPWLVMPRRLPHPRTTLLCLHHAGGGASSYRAWVRLLPADVELWMVQLPGREERIAEPALAAVEPVLDAIVAALRPALRGPYAIFGHSLGATLAYALASRLQASGELAMPDHLFLSGAPAPEAGRESRRLPHRTTMPHSCAGCAASAARPSSCFRTASFSTRCCPRSAAIRRCALSLPGCAARPSMCRSPSCAASAIRS